MAHADCLAPDSPRFLDFFPAGAALTQLATGFIWAEGPVWFGEFNELRFSDIPNNRMMRWSPVGGLSTFRQPSQRTNGHTRDRDGNMISCEHGGRCVSRTRLDGTYEVLAMYWNGKRFNSPNDVVVKSDGSVWFTDPSYGIDSEYEGDASPMEQDGRHVYRIDPDGSITRVIDDMKQPNGLAFSVNESTLFVADTGKTHFPDCAPKIRRYPVNADGKSVGAGEDFVFCDAGLFDGFRLDTNGNIWSSAADGVHCFAPDGTLLGKIRVNEVVANVCFGGPKRNRLFICATTSLRSIYVNATGAV